MCEKRYCRGDDRMSKREVREYVTFYDRIEQNLEIRRKGCHNFSNYLFFIVPKSVMLFFFCHGAH